MQEVSAGIIDKVQYLMWRYGVDEAEATKMMPQQAEEPLDIREE